MTPRRTLPARRRIIEFELEGVSYIAGIGRFRDGTIAEVFLNGGKVGSGVETAARDAAIAASLALQFGAPLDTLRHAFTRLRDGSAAGPIGRALDLIGG